MNPATPAANAGAYRLLRSLPQAAEGEELIDRAPPQVRGASNARPRRKPKPATLDELATIVDHMPERTKLFVVLAAFVGLREGGLLELRRFDVDGVTGRISVERKVEKDVDRYAVGACSSTCWSNTAPGPEGLLFPGNRKDHMSVRYLMDRYRPAREAAGRPELTIHHLRHTALTMAGQHGEIHSPLQLREPESTHATCGMRRRGRGCREP